MRCAHAEQATHVWDTLVSPVDAAAEVEADAEAEAEAEAALPFQLTDASLIDARLALYRTHLAQAKRVWGVEDGPAAAAAAAATAVAPRAATADASLADAYSALAHVHSAQARRVWGTASGDSAAAAADAAEAPGSGGGSAQPCHDIRSASLAHALSRVSKGVTLRVSARAFLPSAGATAKPPLLFDPVLPQEALKTSVAAATAATSAASASPAAPAAHAPVAARGALEIPPLVGRVIYVPAYVWGAETSKQVVVRASSVRADGLQAHWVDFVERGETRQIWLPDHSLACWLLEQYTPAVS